MSVALSPDGRYLASASCDRTVRIWEIPARITPKEPPTLLHLLRGHTDHVTGVSFSHDGQRLASCSFDRTVKLWDVASGREALTLRGPAGRIHGVAFSPNGRFLSSVGVEPKLWEAYTCSAEARAARLAEAEADPSYWHDREGWRCALGQNWFGVTFHLDQMIALAPCGQGLHGRRSYARARLGQWQQAADDADRAVGLWPNDLELRCFHAGVLLLAGRSEDYRKACAGAMSLAGPAARGREAYLVARLGTLAPGGPEPAQLLRLAERAVQVGPHEAHYLHTLGLAHYRAGQYEQAVRRFRESMRANPAWEAQVVNWLGLALAHDHLGERDVARLWFARATKWIERASRPAARAEPYRPCGLHEHDWLACQLLRREVEALVKTPMTGGREK
jgi:tetratricopeptide (TPR) repeat protein